MSSPGLRARLACALGLFTLAAATPAGAEEPPGWSVWTSVQAISVTPPSDYRPIEGSGTWGGLGLQVLIVPPRFPVSIRIEACSNLINPWVNVTDSLVLDTYGPEPDSTRTDVKAGNALSWFTVGAQWDPKPRDTGAYAFASVGWMTVSMEGGAGYADGSVTLDLVNKIPSTQVLALAGGIGARAVFGRGKQHAIVFEAEYVRGGEAEYLGTAEAAAESPGTHVQSTVSALAALSFKLGYGYRFRKK